MPDILQQLIIYIVLIAVVVFFLIRIIPELLGGSHSAAQMDDDDQDLCTHCSYDVRKLVRCPECGRPTREARRQQLVKLREQWPTESIAVRFPKPEEQPVKILFTDDRWAADLLGQHLEARGIRAKLSKTEKIPGAIASAAGRGIIITVWTDDEDRARAIVDHLWPKEIRARE